MMDIVPGFNGYAELRAGHWSVPESIAIGNPGFAPWCTHAFLSRTGIRPGDGENRLLLLRDSGMPAEAYALTVDSTGMQIRANSETGVIWALTTAFCLLRDGQLPCCSITDAPKYAHRGILLDCARHFFSAGEVKRVIEGMSLAKLNVLHWHLSDDQGWRIESRRFPLLHEISGEYYTQQEIREVVEYARARGVEIIPELELPGHTTAILAAYPQYSCSGRNVSLAHSGGIYPLILCPGREEVFDFLAALLEEIVPLFPGKRFHIGGDEAPKGEWKNCACCQNRMREQQLNNLNELQGYFTARVQELLKKHGKQAVCWNETLAADNAPPEIEVQYWTPDHSAEMEPFIQKGGQWVYSDMFELYLDYPYCMTPLKKLCRITPRIGKKICGSENGMLGMECCLWTEHITGDEALERQLFPRAFAVAELCWNGRQDCAGFEKRLREMRAAGVCGSLRWEPESGWNPRGKVRRQGALRFFCQINEGMSTEVRAQTVESAQPSRAFGQNFLRKFFHPTDLPFLFAAMMKMNTKQRGGESHAEN